MLWRNFTINIRHLAPAEQVKVEEAFRLSERLHNGQLRESGEPFFQHPIAVTQYLAFLGADMETLIAALLHDAVEDTPLTLAEVRQRFGEGVATMIEGLTKLEEHSLDDQPTLDAKIESLRRMFSIMEKDVRVMTIKLSDRLHNMQTIGFRPPHKQRAVAKETLDLYVKIADRLCMRELRDELAMLCHAVLEPTLHEQLLHLRKENFEQFQNISQHMKQRIADLPAAPPIDIGFEYKSWDSLLMQCKLEKEITHQPLLLNTVFRCESVDACYQMLGAIHQIWPRIVLTFDDFINMPAINGYRGLQTTVIMEDGAHVRCKIRTHAMDAYAHRGIATVCFDQNARGILHYLPWTRHIGPLAKSNRDRSAAFWETLQSDILSEAFIIYGNENRSVLVPTRATALDGALYLYPEKALRLTTIFINGKKVPFTHVLTRADIVEINVDAKKQVQREWLQWSNTGIGNVLIRTALSGEKLPVKIATGKQLLQEHLLAHHRGYLTELHTDYLADMLKKRGLSGDMNKLYVQIAEGRLLPQDIERLLYPPSAEKKQRTSVWVIRCTALTQNWPSLYMIIREYSLLKLRAKRNEQSQLSSLRATCRLTEEEAEQLGQILQRAGAESIDIRQTSLTKYLLTSLIIILWGLNPVIAKWLLLQGITPMTLVSLRMITVGIGATILYAIWHMLSKGRYSKISITQFLRLSVLPSLTTIALAIFTYNALFSMPPSLHLTILRINILLLPLAHFLHRTKAWILAGAGIVLTVVSVGFLFWTHPHTLGWGIALSSLALCSYVLYATIVERTIQDYKIGLRYPALFFTSGLLMGIAGLALTPFIPWGQLSSLNIVLIILYVLFCVFVPHALFHTILLQSKFFSITKISMLEVPLAIMLEILILGSIQQPILYLVILALFLTIILFMRTAISKQEHTLFKILQT